MAKNENAQSANESISKYKLLSAYGGPGSLLHTRYGSIIISCIEEWGFLKKVIQIHREGIELNTEDIRDYVIQQSRLPRNGSIGISNDSRLLEALIDRKMLSNLRYLCLVPDIEVTTHNNNVKSGVELTIPSTYMPKIFADKRNNYKPYREWYLNWIESNKDTDKYGKEFHPPKYITPDHDEWTRPLKQDNITLLCEHGHISDFPWSKYLKWRIEHPSAILKKEEVFDIFSQLNCCNNPSVQITQTKANATGFDGKWLKCKNPGCIGNKGISLQGLMGIKIKCPGHKPWEAKTDLEKNNNYNFPYSGNSNSRLKDPPTEICYARETDTNAPKPMKVALTTGNNIYYSRILSSIYLHDELFKSDTLLRIKLLESQKKQAFKEDEIDLVVQLTEEIKGLKNENEESFSDIPDSEKEIRFRFNEFKAFHKDQGLLNLNPKDLKVLDVTSNLNDTTKSYFQKILRVDNMKITSAQLDFSRIIPIDADSESAKPKNIFRKNNDEVEVYPVVENFGEGIFFSFNEELISEYNSENAIIKKIQNQLSDLELSSNSFNKKSIEFGNLMNWQMYLVHTFSHLIMRELEFRCGYPTSSLSERIYVSNDDNLKMHGVLIYTAEGSEGSMGGLIAQTTKENLNNLIKSAVKRATICNSDPLCWESQGQGLFDLNFASCFSCSLVSETSCEHRNLYLDRKIIVDQEFGYFSNLIT